MKLTVDGLKVSNYYLFLPNSFSFILTSYFFMSTFRYSPERTQTNIMKVLSLGYGIILLVTMLAFVTFQDQVDLSISILGGLSCAMLIVLNISPLINMREIIKSKSSISIFLPFSIGLFLTGVFWTAYGAFLSDKVFYFHFIIMISI